MPAAEMACGVDMDTSVLDGSNIQENWETDFSGMAGMGSNIKSWEVEV